jgi:hypothetical protein
MGTDPDLSRLSVSAARNTLRTLNQTRWVSDTTCEAIVASSVARDAQGSWTSEAIIPRMSLHAKLSKS